MNGKDLILRWLNEEKIPDLFFIERYGFGGDAINLIPHYDPKKETNDLIKNVVLSGGAHSSEITFDKSKVTFTCGSPRLDSESKNLEDPNFFMWLRDKLTSYIEAELILKVQIS